MPGLKDSEKSVEEWLGQIGATKIEHVGDGPGPPDFVIEYAGEDRIAVEACCLHEVKGWDKREYRQRKFSFERELGKLIAEAARGENAPRWHAFCEYDGVECVSSIKDRRGWMDKAIKALRTPGTGGEFQLLSKEARRGRGVILTLMPATNEGSFARVSTDEGSIVGTTLSDQIVAGISEKADKVRRGPRAKKYDQWWLVFDDEILVAPADSLAREHAEIEARVRDLPDTTMWSKIVLMSRFQTVPPPQTAPKRYWSVWEDSNHLPLPQ